MVKNFKAFYETFTPKKVADRANTDMGKKFEQQKQLLQQAYVTIKTALKGTGVTVYTAEENNALCDKKLSAEENRLDNMNVLIICSDLEEDMDDDILGGAYSVEMVNGEVQAEWMPYPEDPIIGVDNIIKDILKQIA